MHIGSLFINMSQGLDSFNLKIKISVTEASKTAQYAIEKEGGSIDFVYYNRLGLRSHLKPEKFDLLPKLARPPRKWAIKHDVENHL